MAGLVTRVRRGKWFKSGSLLDATTSNASGLWQPIEGLFPLTVEVSGDFVATVKLYVSTDEQSPMDSIANHGALKTFTTPDIYILNAPAEWVRVEVTGYSSGTVRVSAEASEANS